MSAADSRDRARNGVRPFFRADHVGSLLRPAALHEARARFAKGEIDRDALHEVEDSAIRDAVKMQEEVGLPVVTDGEFRRAVWWSDFIFKIEGTALGGPDESAAFKKDGEEAGYLPKIVLTTGKLARRGAIMAEDYACLAGCAHALPKLTIPSPSRIHFHGGRDAIDRAAYPTMDAFWDDIVRLYREEIAAIEALGCRYIQIDDPVMSYFLQEPMREKLRARGEDPDETLATYVRVINEAVAGRKSTTNLAIHICRGNAGNAWAAAGGYGTIAEIIFPHLDVDSYLLEYDDERSGDFVPLKLIPKGKKIVLGLITTKHGEIEDLDVLRKRLDEAGRYVSLADCAVSPQCGFASTVGGNDIDYRNQVSKLRLVVDLARAVWGSA
ncbi:MAG: 5-methyltetrahydropteroyltriglutamate--homocysteine S-methyltransferase [Rhodospirillaceae bacterium]|nr:5-methyltetrahydropteroyltriglutamate--homocysteine S-methyltransferase [Rhodospirillaceae bacterium]